MKVIVIGAGAWGLPSAAELVRRGHTVVLIDQHGPANALGSSHGPTRIWRLSHPDRARVRLAVRSVDAMRRLEQRSGEQIFVRRGLLWRDDGTVEAVASALAAENIEHQEVDAADVGEAVPGLIADDRDAVWQADAGSVLAAVSMRAQIGLFESGGGRLLVGSTVRSIETTTAGVDVTGDGGLHEQADAIVVAAGPGSGTLLGGLGVDIPLRPRLEQVVHFGAASGWNTDAMACLFDGPTEGRDAMYAMPTPGIGYKVGLDTALRELVDGDRDRTPDAVLIADAAERVRTMLRSLDPTPLDATVCSWTESPDNRFVIDTLGAGIVVACGDGGEGFKFSALMGEVLADLAEGGAPDADIASFGLDRFATGYPDTVHVLGR